MQIPSSFINELNDITRFQMNEPLKKYTTFKTGGPADIFIDPVSQDELKNVLSLTSEYGIPRTIIGGGSNLLISDKGLDGVVIRISGENEFCKKVFVDEKSRIVAGAGVAKGDFIDYCLNNSRGGVEFMAGIPGTIGGGVFMNAGTNMGDFSDVVSEIELMDSSGSISRMAVHEGMAGYRSFPIPQGSIILGAMFSLPDESSPAALREKIEEILRDREVKHPLEYPSAGSVFKNPSGFSSWQLVQNAGLKGKKIGGAMISEKHTNFIINTGDAHSSDIFNLIELVKEKVQVQFNLTLESEIRILGDFS